VAEYCIAVSGYPSSGGSLPIAGVEYNYTDGSLAGASAAPDTNPDGCAAGEYKVVTRRASDAGTIAFWFALL
jgi:hypothetical protein